MTLLCDADILDALKFGEINIEPFNEEAIQPASVDLHLDKHFLYMQNNIGRVIIDPMEDQKGKFTKTTISKEGVFYLQPGEFCLASTYEKVTLDSRHAARFEGKSSLGRLGLLTHITAGFIDPGFSGHITLELSNVTPYAIALRPGMRIGQACFMKLERGAHEPYGSVVAGSHYQNQDGPVASRSFANFKMVDVYSSRRDQRL